MWTAVAKAFFLVSVMLGATGCRSVAPVVKVGLVAPFEGRNRPIGYDAIYSARLAVREINAAGGIGGQRVSLVALDDRGDPVLARQAAASLALDPAVVAVVGHYLPDTTAVTIDDYDHAGLVLVPMGTPPFFESDPSVLPPDFLEDYAAVTPFDEIAGPFAGSTYDAFGLLWQVLAQAEETTGQITRASVQDAAGGLKYRGITGEVYLP